VLQLEVEFPNPLIDNSSDRVQVGTYRQTLHSLLVQLAAFLVFFGTLSLLPDYLTFPWSRASPAPPTNHFAPPYAPPTEDLVLHGSSPCATLVHLFLAVAAGNRSVPSDGSIRNPLKNQIPPVLRCPFLRQISFIRRDVIMGVFLPPPEPHACPKLSSKLCPNPRPKLYKMFGSFPCHSDSGRL